MRCRMGRHRGGWWLFTVMITAVVVGLPLMTWLGQGLEAARGVRGWEWRLEGIRRVREAAGSVEADRPRGVAGSVTVIDGLAPRDQALTMWLEERSGADPGPGRLWFRWAGDRGAVLLVADFSGDFSDNVSLLDPEIFVISGAGDLEEAAVAWGPGREERLQQRDSRVEAWRELLRTDSGAGSLLEPVSDPGAFRWLAGSFRPGGTEKDATLEHGEQRGEASSPRSASLSRGRFLEDGDADEVEVVPSGHPIRPGSGR
jgi:hypothetical protein